MSRRIPRVLAVAAALAVTVTACSTTPQADSSSAPSASGAAGAPQKVTLQLQWFTQGQFAGYFAAVDQGFYAKQGLDVEIKEGGVDIVPQTVLAQGQADYAIAWVPKALASREQGAGDHRRGPGVPALRAPTRSRSRTRASTAPADLRGKKVGNWGFGNEFELFAGMTEAGLKPVRRDAGAAAVRHAGAAVRRDRRRAGDVLQRVRAGAGGAEPGDRAALPARGLHRDQLERRRHRDAAGRDLGQHRAAASDPAYQDTTTKFIAASLQGWAYCRDNVESCRDIVVKAGSTLGASHQLWQINEVNKLIWPSPAAGAGTIDQAAWDRTVQVARTAVNADGQTVLTKDPDAGGLHQRLRRPRPSSCSRPRAWTWWAAAYQPIEVTLQPNGA